MLNKIVTKLALLSLTLSLSIMLIPGSVIAVEQKNTINKASYSSSQIVTIDTLENLKNEVNNLDDKSLVIFDIDKVLEMKEDPWERGFDEERKKSETINSLFVEGSVLNKKLDRATRDKLWSIYAKSLKVALVEKNAPKIVRELQTKAKLMCLTRFFTGKIGIIPSMDDLRIKGLKTLGYDFKNAFPEHNDNIFNEFIYEDKHPLFRDGVLFTTLAVSKGDLLKAFLDRINWRPSRVILIDDKIENLKSVEEYLNNAKIPFVGYEYIGYSKVPMYFDKNLAEFQMKYLIKHETWLDSDAARKLMKENNEDFINKY